MNGLLVKRRWMFSNGVSKMRDIESMKRKKISVVVCILGLLAQLGAALPAQADGPATKPGQKPIIKVAAAQPRSRLIGYQLRKPADVLVRVDGALDELAKLIDKAGAAHCDVIAFPEDTLGLGTWEAGNKPILKDVLPTAVQHMLERLGQAAAAHQMYLVCCNDTIEKDGSVQNTAFFLGRDGKEIGRYHKVNMPIHELDKKRGDHFPVFQTPDLGGVGMLICYDMVFPEAPRCLALGGADIIFHPTLGGAAVGDDDLSRAAFRTRAAENFVYLVVAQRGNGSMIISPQGKILAEGHGPDELAIAEIDPHGGREGGDAMNRQADMRARLFRERSPAAFGILTDPKPPVLTKVPETMTVEEATSISAKALTEGETRFKEADALVRAGKRKEAIAAFQQLRRDFRQTWIDYVAQERLAKLGVHESRGPDSSSEKSEGLASKYPGDKGIASDPHVLFTENFETGSLAEIGKRWGEIRDPQNMNLSAEAAPASSGKRSLHVVAGMPKEREAAGDGFRGGGHLYTHFRGVDQIYVRFYVKFPPKSGYLHHSVAIIADKEPTKWPKGYAGKKPAGDQFIATHIEPWSQWGKVPPPGAWNFYTYWQEMKPDGRGDYWGNSFQAGSDPIIPGRWYCVEAMVKANSRPDAADGQQAFWVDGQLVKNFKGIRWRSSNDLKFNTLWLLYYVSQDTAEHNRDSQPKDRVYEIWFDDVAVSTEYIGPIRK
jgi:predicted amidohydrolase